MVNTCRDCPADIKQPSVNLIAGDLIWGDRKDGERRVLLEVKPHLIYCKGHTRKPKKPAPVKEPEFVGVVRDYLRDQGYPVARQKELLARAEGVDFDSFFASVLSQIDAEITT